MTGKIDPVVLEGSLGRRWWEQPDALWRKRERVRERRLRVTLARVILPLLQDLESLQRKHYPQAQLLLHGKTVEQVEDDPVALEFALFLYQLALEKNLILTHRVDRGGLVSVRTCLDAPVGSCALTPNAVSRRYVCRLAEPILTAGGHDAEDLKAYVAVNAQSHVTSLARLRILTSLSKAVVTEMSLGLGDLDALAKKDRPWLDTLARADPATFLRPLRKVLEQGFHLILSWPAAVLQAAMEALDHPAKIFALGRNIEEISNPAVFKALGSWPMGQGPKGEVLTRIAMIKAQVGERIFVRLLQGSPGLLSDIGGWPTKKVGLYKEFLAILTGPALQILGALDDDDHRLAVMDALTTRFGPKTLAEAFKTKEGLGGLQGIVNEIAVMNQTAKQTPAKVRNLIAGSYFDGYMAVFQAKA